jgi:serine/threonine protein kinase
MTTTIGEYKIGKLIGEGAFSKVKLGIHALTGQKVDFIGTDCEVAIKIINKKLMQESNEKSMREKAKRAAKKGIALPPTPQPAVEDSSTMSFISKLENEVQLLMRLDHPNVIKTYQVIDSEEECYIVMQYASGGEMMEYMAVKNYLPEKDAKRFFAQLVSALEHIHAANIVHRDLKLENLLLDDKNNILITDFGLGRTYDSDRVHLLDTFCGTPHYAAVELVSGIPYVGIKSDIWALGVILYFLVTGSAPFKGSTIAELYDNIKKVKYDRKDYFSPGTQFIETNAFQRVKRSFK